MKVSAPRLGPGLLDPAGTKPELLLLSGGYKCLASRGPASPVWTSTTEPTPIPRVFTSVCTGLRTTRGSHDRRRVDGSGRYRKVRESGLREGPPTPPVPHVSSEVLEGFWVSTSPLPTLVVKDSGKVGPPPRARCGNPRGLVPPDPHEWIVMGHETSVCHGIPDRLMSPSKAPFSRRPGEGPLDVESVAGVNATRTHPSILFRTDVKTWV